MFKMIAMFKKPEDTEKFDEYYFGTHIPLTEKIPGLQRVEVTKFAGDAPYYMMCEMYYENKEAFKEASKTEESKASGKDVMKLAGDSVTFMFGETTNG
ncbi:EthD family reductase [Falsibacillus pallidus]|uniref:Uncharacterized protein (TIGR02118 family) n=1 Tax=Falsibacillus pallidus TaxID=493781 RepID=A0A370GWE3_9BACI|nr:EthD family reductase [Falsibacillus pallidus]RDI47977.1 uncharacterized protein (TIGR02118 family) [Falsibacillus pallidus]